MNYTPPTPTGLVDAVLSLKSGGVPPKWVIIDDGWQSTDLDREFKSWEEPLSMLARRVTTSKDKSKTDSDRDNLRRESYIEGETEVIAAVARDIPAGSATGVLLQEVIAAEDGNLESLDYETMAQQHGSLGPPVIGGAGKKRKHKNPVIRITGTLVEYLIGLVFGVFQALILLFYQWVVDPASYGSW